LLEQSAPNSSGTGSPDPQGKGDGKDHGLVLKIEYPYEKFIAKDGPQSASEQKSKVPVVTVVPTTKGDQPAPAEQQAPAQQQAPSQSTAKVAWVGKDFAGLFKSVAYTVVRIQTISAEVNWFEPYQQPQDMQLTGSGLAVAMPDMPEIVDDPIFITNAHVVRDAHDVQIQLPALGQEFFAAYVPLICDEFDLAVVQLTPESLPKFFKALTASQIGKLQPHPIVDWKLDLGMEVASVGFPLGSTSLKLSRGVISGTEEVGDFICYQTTAPISPGSSGGPLFALDEDGELRVIGATFASAASRGAQNTNYVVPAVAIIQVLEQYKRQRQIFQQQIAQDALAAQPANAVATVNIVSALLQADAHKSLAAPAEPEDANSVTSSGPGPAQETGSPAPGPEVSSAPETAPAPGPQESLAKETASTEESPAPSTEEAPAKAITTCGGNGKGAPCIFPFKYKGENGETHTYTACTEEDHPGEPWCATSYVSGTTFADDWGQCDQKDCEEKTGPAPESHHQLQEPNKEEPVAPKVITQLPAPSPEPQPAETPKETSVDEKIIAGHKNRFQNQLAGNQQRNQKAKRLPHFQFKIAPIDAVGIEANPALYKAFGCKNGVFISKILSTSVFKFANPEVKERCFLTAVDGVSLDAFGMGRTGQFLHDPTPFESLMMMKVRPGDSVTLTTCGADGQEQQHTISMEWTPAKYLVGINNVVEPFWDPKAMRYELFAGITVMQLTVNHIIKLLRIGQPPTLGRWLLPENQDKKRLLITHVEAGTYASRVVAPGMVIAKVNDQEVGTLDEYMKIFMPPEGTPTWKLETDRGVLFATNFKESLFDQLSKAESGLTFMFCQSVVDAAQKMTGQAKAGQAAAASLVQASGGSGGLVQTSSTSNAVLSITDTADERVTRLAKRQALAMSARAEGEDNGISTEEEERRRMRVAHAGFRTLAASQYIPDDLM